MTSINQKIQNPLFFVTFFGPIIAGAVTGVLLLTLGHKPAAVLFLVAAGVYLVGAFIPTMVVNVPLNETLDAAGVPTDPAEAARAWSDYCVPLDAVEHGTRRRQPDQPVAGRSRRLPLGHVPVTSPPDEEVPAVGYSALNTPYAVQPRCGKPAASATRAEA